FVVNLNGSGQRAYLRVGITPGLAHPLPTRNHPLEIPPMVPVQSLGNKEPRTKKVERQTRKAESEELRAKSQQLTARFTKAGQANDQTSRPRLSTRPDRRRTRARPHGTASPGPLHRPPHSRAAAPPCPLRRPGPCRRPRTHRRSQQV